MAKLPPRNGRSTAWRVSDIVSAVAIATGGRVSPAAITNGVKQSEVVTARWAAIVMARHAGYSLPEISRGIGVDHTTAINALCFLVGDRAGNHPRYEEAAALIGKAGAVLAQAQAAFDAVLSQAMTSALVSAAPPTPEPTPEPEPRPEPMRQAPPKPRFGAINRRGEIIVGAPRNEVI